MDESNIIFKKYWYIGVISVIVIFVFINLVFYFFPTSSEHNDFFHRIKKRKIKSIIIRKSIDYKNHGATYVVYKDDSLPTHTGWDEKIEIGDSILKELNSLKLIIKNQYKIDTLDYKTQKGEILELPHN